ncbi:MAG: hypothetical protein JWR07_1920 [Nevskia sp.]|nr:hypothetical protein [Nevskia sp.]
MDRLTQELGERTVMSGANERAGPGAPFLPVDTPLARLSYLDDPDDEASRVELARQMRIKKAREQEFAERLNNHHDV